MTKVYTIQRACIGFLLAVIVGSVPAVIVLTESSASHIAQEQTTETPASDTPVHATDFSASPYYYTSRLGRLYCSFITLNSARNLHIECLQCLGKSLRL